jgi:hypothetical protein
LTKHFVLIDACVAAAHFAPKSTQSANLRKRSTALLTGSSPDVQLRFLIPNFCIAEVFSVFEKYRWGRTWNKQVKPSHALTPKEFAAARTNFGDAIHNGSLMLQAELGRYHILSIDLISPVNAAYQIQRRRGRNKKINPRPASTYDMLIAAMGIWLQHEYGGEHFTIVTGDERLRLVVDRAKSVKLSHPIKAHLNDVAADLGLKYGPDLYPEVLNLTRANISEIEARFPNWNPGWQ